MWALGWLACDDPTGPTVPSDAVLSPHSGSTRVLDSGAHTGTPGTAPPEPPSQLTATCAATDNALRFRCAVEVEPPQAVQVTFQRADAAGAMRLATSPGPEGTHDVGLYFLAPETRYTYTATATAWPDTLPATGELTTGAVPAAWAASLTVTGTSSTPYVGGDLPCGTGATAAVFDTSTGELVWYEVAAPEGNFGGMEMVRFTAEHTVLGMTQTQVMELDLMGADLRRWSEGFEYREDLHHDLFRWDDKYYLLFRRGNPQLDGFLVLDAGGNLLAEWYAGDYLDLPPTASGDYMHTNTITVDAGVVTLSSFQQSTVFQVDGDPSSATFGAPGWFLAGSSRGSLGNDFALDWSLVGGPNLFRHQHDTEILADGRLLMLDNDAGRALIVRLDTGAGTATVEEAYPASRPFCGPQGTAGRTSTGNILVDCSGFSLLEYEPNTSVPVWRASLACSQAQAPTGGVPGTSRWYPLDDW
jgi:hypothetical protein